MPRPSKPPASATPPTAEPTDPPKRRPGRPPTGAQKASITFSLPVDLIAWLVEIGGKETLSPTVERLLQAARARGDR